MKVLCVFAHPDDESFSSGGTIAKLAKSGHNVSLICATKGEAGLVGDPPIATQDQLGEIREKEQKAAAKILGIRQIFYLGLIDGTLHKYSINFLTRKILPIVIKEKPDVLITFDEHGISNHKDHIAVSKSATLSFKKYAKNIKKHVKLYYATIPKSYLKKYRSNMDKTLDYKAFGEMIGTNDSKITTVIDIKKTFKTKVRALNCHKTQHKDVERFLRRSKAVDLKKEFFLLALENQIT